MMDDIGKHLFIYFMTVSVSLQLDDSLPTLLKSQYSSGNLTFSRYSYDPSTYTDETQTTELLAMKEPSTIRCAISCAAYQSCYTFYYNMSTGMCHLLNDLCRTSDQTRFNCGNVGVSAAECRSMGCCYNTERNLCFRSIPCNRPQSTPEDCGWSGISSQQCHQQGCCENRYTHTGEIKQNVHWCIRPK